MNSQVSVDVIRNAYQNHSLDQVIDLSTDAIHHVQQWDLIPVLDRRAHAFGMKGHFEKAVQDAEEIISFAPTRAIGYLRLGQLFAMQGKQLAAIQIYEEALTKVEKQQDNGDSGHQELIQRKMRAMEKNDQRLDFITVFPLEIIDSIFEGFGENTKLISMQVSTKWRNTVMHCPNTWKTLNYDFYYFWDRPDRVAEMMPVVPHVAKHVMYMHIGTNSEEMCQKNLELLEKGYFKRIKTLEMTDSCVKHLTLPNRLISLTNALWQIRSTLTKLNMSFLNIKTQPSIAELLFYLPHLKTLILDIKHDPLEKSIGHMEYLGGPHVALEDVELETRYKGSSGRVIKPFLEYCPNIRRLVLENCSHSIINAVNEICNERLQIFACSTSIFHGITSLEDLDHREYYDGPLGLREIIIEGGYDDVVPAEIFLRLLYKNRKSLEKVVANLNLTQQLPPGEAPYFSHHHATRYQQWYFERLRQLTFWSDNDVLTEAMFLKPISSCKTPFELFSVANNTPNIPMIVDTLIHLPPVEILEFMGAEYDEEQSTALVRLFDYYASFPPEEKKTLHTIRFRYFHFMTDQVLLALSRVASLRTIDFY
ncbi:hypothetical protein BDA99DRAFT_526806, partial [Phascolomyces articulosus]